MRKTGRERKKGTKQWNLEEGNWKKDGVTKRNEVAGCGPLDGEDKEFSFEQMDSS